MLGTMMVILRHIQMMVFLFTQILEYLKKSTSEWNGEC